MKETAKVPSKSPLEEMRSKLKRISDENARKQLLKEGMKTNIEKRKEGIEEVLKKTELVKEQAKLRREELEKGKLKKEKAKEVLKATSIVPEQVGSVSSSSDKNTESMEIQNELEEIKSTDVTIDKGSVDVGDIDETKAKTSSKENFWITRFLV